MQKIKGFWINSYKSDKVAFGFELISFIFTVMASLTLRRGAAWVMLLTGYFAVINVFGYGVAALWW